VRALRELETLATARGLAAEDWTRGVRFLCKACSEGRPHEHHDPEPTAELAEARPHRVAIAAPTRREVNDLLDDWQPARFEALLGAVQIAFSHA
jgi:hypothetical protein